MSGLLAGVSWHCWCGEPVLALGVNEGLRRVNGHKSFYDRNLADRSAWVAPSGPQVWMTGKAEPSLSQPLASRQFPATLRLTVKPPARHSHQEVHCVWAVVRVFRVCVVIPVILILRLGQRKNVVPLIPIFLNNPFHHTEAFILNLLV